MVSTVRGSGSSSTRNHHIRSPPALLRTTRSSWWCAVSEVKFFCLWFLKYAAWMDYAPPPPPRHKARRTTRAPAGPAALPATTNKRRAGGTLVSPGGARRARRADVVVGGGRREGRWEKIYCNCNILTMQQYNIFCIVIVVAGVATTTIVLLGIGILEGTDNTERYRGLVSEVVLLFFPRPL